MFAIHRSDPRKSVDDALDTARQFAQMFCCDFPTDPSNPASLRAQYLYDLAFILFELHENVAGQRITTDQCIRALTILDDVRAAWDRNFGKHLPADKTADAFDGLHTLLAEAAGLGMAQEHEAKRVDNASVSWLQNVAHNAWNEHVMAERRRRDASLVKQSEKSGRVVLLFPADPTRGGDLWT